MNDWRLSCHDQWPDDAQVVDAGLDAFNADSALRDVRPIACLAHDGSGQVLGGALGRTWGGCAELQQLWVAAEHRGRGLGRALLHHFEQAVQQRGVERVYLSTFSFQAPGFYARLGYVEALRIDGFGRGNSKFHFVRELADRPDALAVTEPATTAGVRGAVASDLPGLAVLFDQYRQFYEQPGDLPRALEFITQRFERGESVILVAVGAGAALHGFCQLYPSFCSVEAQPIYVLYDLFVAPGARGLGVGARLLAAAEERARADGKARMDLTTAHTNLRAQALYTRMGWQLDEVFRAYTRRITA